MVLYITIIVALVILLVLSILGRMTPKKLNKTQMKYYKKTEIICLSIFICAFIFFIIGEVIDVLYPAFDIVGIVLLVASFAFYFYQKFNYKKLTEEDKNVNNELMKISILQNCSLTKEEATSELEALDITVVQKIGRQLVCYKQSDNAKNPIIFEK